ncbi:MAG: (2Fe-2S)-binding protein [Betaproteobacteria bacterium]|nr:(2Fe-2S)-binding protein [Betaproteobacteria bacterium]
MDETADITLTVNGEAITSRVPVRRNIVDFLRVDLGLTGSHVGCEHGVCGACTVRVDGRITRGCLMLAVQADGGNVETIEGLSDSGSLRELQQEFLARNALQCGFCTSGMLLTANELLSHSQNVTREEVREYLSGNFCRCTGYQAIIDAIMAVADKRGLAA